MRIEAASSADVAAAVTGNHGALGASLIPVSNGCIAAEWIAGADDRAARIIGAARGLVREEAAAIGRGANSVDNGILRHRAGRARGFHAGEVPADGAAEVVDVADRVAADGVGASWLDVHGAAGARGRIGGIAVTADALAGAADISGDLSAQRVPANLAAELISSADGFAADAIATKRSLVLVAAVASARIAAAEAEALGPRDTRLIPRDRAAGGIDVADLRAAGGVVAVWVLVHTIAGARGGLATLVGELDCLVDAVHIPLNRAAVLETKHGANGGADDTVVAGRRGVRREAALGDRAATRAILGGDRNADIVPRNIAAGWFDSANESAAVGVVAAWRNEVRREAGVGRGGAGDLRRCARTKRKQRRCEEEGEDRKRAEGAHGESVERGSRWSGVRVEGRGETRGGHHGTVSNLALPELSPVMSLKGAPMSEKPVELAAE